MRYFVYVHEECKNEAKKYGFLEDVINQESKIEMDQSIESWDTYLPFPIIKKSLGKSGRLVAVKIPFNEDIIICMKTFLSKSSSEYKKFDQDRMGYLNKISEDMNDIKKVYNKKILDNSIPEPQPPSDQEKIFLYPSVCSLDSADGLIFESKDWVKRINDSELLNYRSRFFDLICKKVINDSGHNIVVEHDESPIKILFKKNKYLLPSGDTVNGIFLVVPMLKDECEKSFCEKYSKIIENNDIIEIETLIRESRKSYPALIFAEDEKVWYAIESNEEGNLALSPQESNLLDQIRHRKPTNNIFPLFINGHPGTGKTTILQYLFADFLYLYLTNKEVTNYPIYLTYNQRLLHTARDTVRVILQCNSNLSSRIDVHDRAVIKTMIGCFIEFHKFLLDMLPEKVSNQFIKENLIDFIRFKKIWFKRGRSEADTRIQKFSPELIWHVIRTYIKGMRNENGDYLDPESYEELPESKRTVIKEDYKLIYTSIWENWYYNLCRKNNYWDDQDLTRAVLDSSENNLSIYPAIFCDESQDFTRNELELILKFNLFSKRNVQPHELKYIPFVFAGDPFQTLNPTGFDWEMVKNSFYEKIIQGLDKNGKAQLDFNYGELNLNYRSTKHIVALCNTIHLLRGILFNKKNLIPQEYWFDENADENFYFDISHNTTKIQMKKLSDLVIIIPCQENEENDYIARDEDLLKIQEEIGESFTCFSPMSIKGSEFPRVVLYKFGDDYLNNYPELLTPLISDIKHTDNPEIAIPLEYYINRLYVAASRAQQNLIIVDTEKGIEKFWENEILKDSKILLSKYKTEIIDEWINSIGWVMKSIEGYWGKDTDPNEIGEILLQDGSSEQDIRKLESAENYFKRADNREGILKCRSKRYELSEDFKLAGVDYFELGENEKALNCFWQDDAILNEIVERKEFEDTPEYKVADYLLNGKRKSKDSIDVLAYLSQKIQDQNRKIFSNVSIWKMRINSILEIIMQQSYSEEKWKTVNNHIGKIINSNFEIGRPNELSMIAYYAHEYKDAIRYFDKMENPPVNSKMYQIVKSNITVFPKNVEWLYKLNNYEDIISDHEKHNHKTYTVEDSKCIINSYLKVKNLNGAIGFVDKRPNLSYVEMIESEININNTDQDFIARLDFIKLRYYLRMDRWTNAYSIFKKYFNKEGLFEQKITGEFLKQVSTSDKFVEVDKNVKKDFAKKLSELFINKNKITDIDIEVVGACIEKANEMVYAFEFYELIWLNPPSNKRWDKNEEEFAKSRWLKCKAKYLIKEKNAIQKVKLENEIEKYKSSWNIEPNRLPEFPALLTKIIEGKSKTGALNLKEKQITFIRQLIEEKNMTTREISEGMNVPLEQVKLIAEMRNQ